MLFWVFAARMCEFSRREKLSAASRSQHMKNEIPLPANKPSIARAQLAKFAAACAHRARAVRRDNESVVAAISTRHGKLQVAQPTPSLRSKLAAPLDELCVSLRVHRCVLAVRKKVDPSSGLSAVTPFIRRQQRGASPRPFVPSKPSPRSISAKVMRSFSLGASARDPNMRQK